MYTVICTLCHCVICPYAFQALYTFVWVISITEERTASILTDTVKNLPSVDLTEMLGLYSWSFGLKFVS